MRSGIAPKPLQEQRRFSHPRLPAYQHQRAGHDPASQHPVHFGYPLRQSLLSSLSLGEGTVWVPVAARLCRDDG